MGEYKGKERHLGCSWRDCSFVMTGVALATTSVCVIHVKPRKEHGANNDDNPYIPYCSTKVYTLVADMESGENTFCDFGALLYWDDPWGS